MNWTVTWALHITQGLKEVERIVRKFLCSRKRPNSKGYKKYAEEIRGERGLWKDGCSVKERGKRSSTKGRKKKCPETTSSYPAKEKEKTVNKE